MKNGPWTVTTNSGYRCVFSSIDAIADSLKQGLPDDITDILIEQGDRIPVTPENKLTKIYEVRTGIGESLGLFRVVAYCDSPTFTLESTEGKQLHWKEDLCREATPGMTLQYWRERAEYFESLSANGASSHKH